MALIQMGSVEQAVGALVVCTFVSSVGASQYRIKCEI